MKSRPLLMKYFLVCATLRGFKTETRRLTNRYKMEAGDSFWIREIWSWFNGSIKTVYKADYLDCLDKLDRNIINWKSPLIMHRAQSRLILNLAEVRQERLGDITEAGAIAEGVGAFRTPEMIDLDIWPHFQKNGKISQKGWDTAELSFVSLWESVGGNWELDKDKMIWVFRWETFEVIK